MITHLEPDLPQCEVKWALESITINKASGGDGIPVELFQILKDDAVKVLRSICQNLENSAMVSGLEKVSFQSKPKKGNAKECSKYHTIALISHASEVMLKILQARLQQDVNLELPDVQVGGSWQKQESSRKTSISALLIMPKPLTVWITISCGKF